MKIRNKLTLLFTLLTGGILLFFAVFIYFSSAGARESEFYKSLVKEAMTKANVLLGAKVEAETLQTIYRKNREILSEVEVAIYDTDFNLLYHDAVDIDFVKETEEMIDEIVEKGEIRFVQEGWQVVGVLFNFEGEDYVITAAAYDEYGYNKLLNLRNTLGFAWMVSILVVFFLGKLFARRALKPVSNMVDKMEEITAKNLDLRLNEGKGKDELSELAITFNEMLDRLENSFDAQKSFVSNIAHEIRTPLSSIISELDWASLKDRSKDEYINCIKSSLEDSKKLSKIVTALLDLAKASYDISEIVFKNVRIEDLIMDARTELLRKDPNYKIPVKINFEPDSDLMVKANAYLLKTAFSNLMENACKFSDNFTCEVLLNFYDGKIKLRFIDSGIGIPEDQQSLIFKPFFRADNSPKNGTGIGLSLALKIIDLHKGELSLNSELNKGTEICVSLPVN